VDGSEGGCGDLVTLSNVPNALALDSYVVDALAPRFTVGDRNEAVDLVDEFALHQVRVLPNPNRQLVERGLHPERERIARGEMLFGDLGGTGANCAECHNPATNFLDGRTHGEQADWNQLFIDKYRNDLRLAEFDQTNGVLPETSGRAARSQADLGNDLAGDRIQFFRADGRILDAAVGQPTEADDFNVIRDFGLNAANRFALPGNPYGVYKFNTPSLRGVWDRQNFLHDGRAWSLREVVLAPGHAALGSRFGETERGYATDNRGARDVHGRTSSLTAEDMAALLRYVESIE
jgi:cytochrome c peroxidase